MEPFRLSAQSVAFLAMMAAVALIVAFAAPFGSIALGAAALAAIGAVLVKAMLRTRRWWPLTAVEGTVALSGLVLMVGAVAVVVYSMVRLGDGWQMAIGWPSVESAAAAAAVDDKVREGPLPDGRNVHFPDAALQKQFTDWLAQKGIAHQVVTMRGDDYVVWNESRGDLAREFIESRAGAGCKGKVAAAKAEQGGRC